jgi:hypothetical protein
MILIAAALGNSEEAFIERRFSDGLNIIYSDDNNKGKTILIQSIMYSIGNTPIFPAALDSKKYYFYSKFSHDNRAIEFLRKGNSILVREQGLVTLFDSITDFKIFFSEEIFRLPKFIKDNRVVVADVALFFQTFFLPQDKRNTSTVINGQQFNKTDFISMMKALVDPSRSIIDYRERDALKARRKEILKQVGLLSRRMNFSRDNPVVAGKILQSVSDGEFQKLGEDLQRINQEITENVNKRNREKSRSIKLQSLLSELNSLNRNIEIGKVKCGDCGSEKIVYSNGDFTFDVSNDVVRREIVASIQSQISKKSDALAEYGNEISRLQLELQEKIYSIPTEIADILISREAILSERDTDQKISELNDEINSIDQLLEQQESIEWQLNENVNKKISEIVDEMRKLYAEIDEVESSSIEGLFTKHNENFSGSEEQIFYFSKLVAIAKHLKIPFPLIVDCFREISTSKEQKMIKEYAALKKQVVLTSTLKKEEYLTEKYPNSDTLNALDYSQFSTNKLLQPLFCEDFRKILEQFYVETKPTV